MPDPVEQLKQTSDALLVAETDLDPTRVGLEDVPPAPVAVEADKATEPKHNTHPVPPQKPSLPEGGDHDESKGGLPEKQPSQKDGS